MSSDLLCVTVWAAPPYTQALASHGEAERAGVGDGSRPWAELLASSWGSQLLSLAPVCWGARASNPLALGSSVFQSWQLPAGFHLQIPAPHLLRHCSSTPGLSCQPAASKFISLLGRSTSSLVFW